MPDLSGPADLMHFLLRGPQVPSRLPARKPLSAAVEAPQLGVSRLKDMRHHSSPATSAPSVRMPIELLVVDVDLGHLMRPFSFA